jgi:dTDP-4-dehydrorhamnose reductase
VINAAAYTAVDKAETEREAAFALNAHGPARLASFCAERRVPLIHISTDYVFDGAGARPYVETDQAVPINVYGESKRAGEIAAAEKLARHIIIRTSWLYSPFGQNFVKTMLRLAAERDRLRVVADQHGRPTSAHAFARVIWAISTRLKHGTCPASIWGLYHYADAGEASWADLAEAIFASPEAAMARKPQVERIMTADYLTLAKRPRYSVLDTTRIETVFGVQPPSWRESLRDVMARLGQEAHA